MNKKHKKLIPVWLEWTIVICAALIIAFCLRTWVVSPYYIPSASMEPTLKIGDRFLGNKMSYKIHDIQRGDIIVFDPWEKAKEQQLSLGEEPGSFIKRVIAMPGETVEGKCENDSSPSGEQVLDTSNNSFCDGIVYIYINGKKLEEPYLQKNTQSKAFEKVKIPKDHIWVLGDNRLNSEDSTFFGPLEIKNVQARAFLRVLPINKIKFF